MSDLRQGVTETQHAVLDLIEARAGLWAEIGDFEDRLNVAVRAANKAWREPTLRIKRMAAMEAAARLIDVADEIGRLIDVGDGA